jgi:hypothetical protein
MKGSAAIFVIIGILVVIFVSFLFFKGYLGVEKLPLVAPSPSPALSDDPKYKEVKEKYNLSEEQLQILSTVDPNDNE